MNPLPNEWAIKHRAEFCAATRRPFASGEFFYTLLYHDADGYQSEDLSEDTWRNRNENIRPFSYWKWRNELLRPITAEPIPSEHKQQILLTVMATNQPPTYTR